MKQSYFLAIILLFGLLGCKKDSPTIANSNDTYSEPRLVWKTRIADSVYYGTMRPIIYNDKVIYSKGIVAVGVHEPLFFLNKENGTLLYNWDDYQLTHEEMGLEHASHHIYNNIFAFGTGPRTYAVDMNTGQTLWKTSNFDSAWGTVTGIGSTLLHSYILDYPPSVPICSADINIGNWVVRHTINKTEGYKLSIHDPISFVNNIGDTMIVFTGSNYDPYNNICYDSLYMYNLTQNDMLWQIQMMPPGGSSERAIAHLPVLYQGRIYVTVGNNILCYNTLNGQKVWERLMQRDFFATQVLVREGVLYANTEDGYLSAINANSGDIKWSVKSSGTCSYLCYHHGIIYFVGGGDGLLHAVDAQTGNHIWKYQSPDQNTWSGAFFQTTITIDTLANRLYTGNYVYALCYETVR